MTYNAILQYYRKVTLTSTSNFIVYCLDFIAPFNHENLTGSLSIKINHLNKFGSRSHILNPFIFNIGIVLYPALVYIALVVNPHRGIGVG